MDFEWQTRAPGDVTSPFYQLGMQHENKKRECLTMTRANLRIFLTSSHLTGTHSAFDSPEKKPLPALRAPNSQPFLFSQPQQQPAPTSPKSIFGQPAFTTPRKLDLEFSSGAENVSSPENADNEDTPEQPSKTEKRNSLFNLYGRFAPSSGRGEIPRMNHYSNALARRVQKRRRRNRELGRQVRPDSDDESDQPSSSEGKTGKSTKKDKGQKSDSGSSRMSSFSEFFALLEAHPNVPSILSWWAQLVVNLALFSLAVYVVFAFVSVIRAEFEQAAEEVSDTILAEMATCAKSYVDNKCAGGDRLPALETVCENWERCMNRDPAKVGRAKVSAQTMALIINSFIDPISWKAMVCLFCPVIRIPLTVIVVVLPGNYINRHCRQQLVLPFVSEPPEPTGLLTTRHSF